MARPGPNVRANAALALATAAIVLAPYATLTLAYRQALVAQAALILAATVALLLAGALRAGAVRRLLWAPRPVAAGVTLYALAAALGGVVALVRGNEHGLLAGQLLSLGLLPLGFVAAVAAAATTRPGALGAMATTLTTAAAAACTAHLIYGAVRVSAGLSARRLAFANAVGAAGFAMLALLFALALAGASSGWRRRQCVGAALIIVAEIALGGPRSLWLATGLAVIAYVSLGYGVKAFWRQRTFVTLAVAIAVALTLAAATRWWWRLPRPDLLAGIPSPTTESARAAGATVGERVLVERLPVAPGSYRWRCELVCTRAGRVDLEARVSLPAGESIVRRAMTVAAHSAGKVPCLLLVPVPETGAALSVALVDREDIVTSVLRPSLAPVGHALVAALANMVIEAIVRPPDPDTAHDLGVLAADASLAFRAKESIAVLKMVRSASWAERLFGFGLGARYSFSAVGWDNQGHIVQFSDPNYIHNFYLFLLFKLGVVGAAMVLAALALWLRFTVCAVRRCARGSPERLLLAAAAAAWLGYAFWSLVAPEILSFHIAPLWGFVLASTALAAKGDLSRTIGA
jgi:hypothetical protein